MFLDGMENWIDSTTRVADGDARSPRPVAAFGSEVRSGGEEQAASRTSTMSAPKRLGITAW